jgi:tetratricopeptide (TPR) repeat protein
MLQRVGLLALAVLASSCLQPGARAPSASGQPWVELETEHFKLVSDLSGDNAGRVVSSFEETYGLLGKVLFAGQPVPSYRTNAVIFEHHQDLNEFVGEGFGGVYLSSLPNDPEPSPTLLATGTLSPFARLTFAHELTHRFNHVALGPTPTWLNEGLADYYSTIRQEHGRLVVGDIDPRFMCTPDGLGDLLCWQYEKLPGNRLPSATALRHLDRNEFYGTDTLESGNASWEQKRKRAEHYGLAWLLVHMLMHGPQAYAERFREVMARPPSSHKGADLAELLEHVPEARLDADLKAYLQNRLPWRQHHAPLPPPSEHRLHALSDAQVLVWWARLDSFQGKFAARAEQRLKDASRAAATEASSTWFWLGRLEQLHGTNRAAEDYYRRALRLEPDNPDYLYGLLDLYWGEQSGMTWVEAARSANVSKTIESLSRTARSAPQLSAIAAYQLFMNDVPAALATSRRACEAGPDCWRCFHNHAAALFASGSAPDALAAERGALSLLSEAAPPRLARMLQDAVAFYAAASSDPGSLRGRERPGVVAP